MWHFALQRYVTAIKPSIGCLSKSIS